MRHFLFLNKYYLWRIVNLHQSLKKTSKRQSLSKLSWTNNTFLLFIPFFIKHIIRWVPLHISKWEPFWLITIGNSDKIISTAGKREETLFWDSNLFILLDSISLTPSSPCKSSKVKISKFTSTNLQYLFLVIVTF